MPTQRAAVARCLAKVMRGQSLAQAMPSCLESLEPEQHGLAQELAYGSLRQLPRLFALSAKLMKKPPRTKDSDIHALILLGMYQLDSMDKAEHAVLTTTVDATAVLNKEWAKGLVNGVLRNYQRMILEGENSGDDPFALNEAETLAHPPWFLGKIKKRWPEHWQQIIEANNQQPPVCLRVNAQQLSGEAYFEQLQQTGLNAELCNSYTAGTDCFTNHAIRLPRAVPVKNLPGFASGQVSVQDEAAQYAAGLLKLKEGLRVLDACAAPGGKTCHILETEPSVELTAIELEERRINRIHDNIQRLQLEQNSPIAPKVICGDALDTQAWWGGQAFDRILLDAPCSATGVIRRHPDIKIHRTPEDIAALSKLQLELLQSLWPLLAEGGYLLYATCSVLPEENEGVIKAFLQHCESASVDKIEGNWPLPQAFGQQLLPKINGSDGFYYCRLQKQKATKPQS